MGTTTRFPFGVTNVVKNVATGMMGQPDPSKFHTYFADFDQYVAGDWTKTVIGTGDAALAAGDGGWLVLTNSAADNDGVQLQLVNASFNFTAGKQAFFKARFKTSDATESDLLIGLAATDTTLLGATGGDGVTDGIFFQKDDGSTTLTCYCQKDTTTGQTSATATTLSNDTFVTVGWYYNGVDEVKVYVDDVHKATLDGTSTYLPNAATNVSMAILNGAAAAKTLTVDYIFACIER